MAELSNQNSANSAPSQSIEQHQNAAHAEREILSSNCRVVADLLSQVVSGKPISAHESILPALHMRGAVSSRAGDSFSLTSHEINARSASEAAVTTATDKIAENQREIDRIGAQRWQERLVNFFSGQGAIDRRTVSNAQETIRELEVKQSKEQTTINAINQREARLQKEQQEYAPGSVASGTFWRIEPYGRRLLDFIEAHGGHLEKLSFGKFEEGCVLIDTVAQKKVMEIATGIQKMLQVGFPGEFALDSSFAWISKFTDSEGLTTRAVELSKVLTHSSLSVDNYRPHFNAMLIRSEEPAVLVERLESAYAAIEKFGFSGNPLPLALFSLRAPSADLEQTFTRAEQAALRISERAGLDEDLQKTLRAQLYGVSDKQADTVGRILVNLQSEGLLPTRELISTAVMIGTAPLQSKLKLPAFLATYRQAASIFGESSDLYAPSALLASGGCITKSHLLLYQDIAGRLIELGYGKDSLVKGARLTNAVLGAVAKEEALEDHEEARRTQYDVANHDDPILDNGDFSSDASTSSHDSHSDSSSSNLGYIALLAFAATEIFSADEAYASDSAYGDSADIASDSGELDHGGGDSSGDLTGGSDIDGGGGGIDSDSGGDLSGGTDGNFDGGADGGIDAGFDGGFDSFDGGSLDSGGFDGGGFDGGGFDGGSGGFDGGSFDSGGM